MADACETRPLDDESLLLREQISPTLAQNVEVRVKQLMLAKNIRKQVPYNTNKPGERTGADTA